ncbi:hypothetical protein HAP47_0016530 [Bradyrhizobium sp. 41S5]|uniref:hypothetical protein n=1 Tax=Bradyrhizobium sp. 41S5 TaxID=1404443 RepID=UPI00156B1E9F|nr:hypothetical protein [Bradyrhizobium sp. 41S5]UFX48175.1 hypothetical protein HAP47_0016530 [Bradyrhizobium sp. 41S5]
MPLAAYLCNVGAALLLLLFAADYYLPKPAIVEREKVYPPVIRIHSLDKLPDRVDFDTTQQLLIVAVPARANTEVADIASSDCGPPATSFETASARAAFALMTPADLRPPTSLDQYRRRPVPQRGASRTKRHPRPRMIVAAHSRQFAWLRYW